MENLFGPNENRKRCNHWSIPALRGPQLAEMVRRLSRHFGSVSPSFEVFDNPFSPNSKLNDNLG